jgi:hypothetical protein
MDEKNTAGGIFNKLPFKKMAEKIPAETREKFPFLNKAFHFANHIVCALAVVLLVVIIAAFSGKKSLDKSGAAKTSDGKTSTAAAAQADDDNERPVVANVNAGDFGYIRNDAKDGIIITYITARATTVVIPDKIENIPVVEFQTNTFRDDKTVRSVTLPATVTSIPYEAFKECTNLSRINMPGVTNIGESAFYSCTSLTTITIPVVTVVEREAFRECTSLSSITMPAITEINYYAFRDCNSLAKVTLGEGLTTLGAGAFYFCRNLIELNVPASLTKFEKYSNADYEGTFDRCHKLPLATRDKLIAQGYSGYGF